MQEKNNYGCKKVCKEGGSCLNNIEMKYWVDKRNSKKEHRQDLRIE